MGTPLADSFIEYEFVTDEEQELDRKSLSAKLVGRRVDILIQQAWVRGTILDFDREKDIHYVLHDGDTERKAYRLR